MSACVAGFALMVAALAFARVSRAQEEAPPLPADPETYPVIPYRVVYGALPPPPPDNRPVFSAKLWAGPGYRHFLDFDTYAGHLGASLGGQAPLWAMYADFELGFGRTDHGLTTYQGWIGTHWEGRIDRFRIGIGAHVGFLGIKRATTGDVMAAVGVGPSVTATFDVLQYEERRALYVGARFDADWIDASGLAPPWLIGPTAMLGWRY